VVTIRKRERSLHLRLTEQEHALLMANCRKCGLGPQTYILKLVQNIQPKEMPPGDFFSVLSSLRRIGNNLRQVALKANAIGFIDTEQYWKNVNELDQIISDLKDFMMQ